VPSDGEVTFELGRSARIVRWVPVILIAWAALFLGSALAAGDGGAIAFAVLWALVTALLSAHWILWQPMRIQAHADRLEFVSRLRRVDVPWERLRSVEGAWGADRLTWRWEGGRLNTTGPWERQHVLLTLVEQRAPSVELKRL
jgi:hypothetical protein